MINSGYLNELLQLSKLELKENYNIDEIGLDDFELINFFLINKALNQETYSLSINIPNRDDKKEFYIPALLSVAATLFFQNFVDDKTSYEVGEIVQKDGKRYKIIGKNDSGYVIASDDADKTQKFPTNRQIKKYVVTTASLSTRQVKTKFHDYRNLFKLLFNEENVPSKFTYKSAIILERKDFLDTLKNENIPSIDLKKAIPFKWVTKKGMSKDESDFIPVEPMVYLLPDYETFKEFVFDGIDSLDSVIFIGKNKYEPHLTKIRKDLRNGEIPRAVFIGSEEIETFQNLRTWKWTQPEVSFFEDKEAGSLTLESVNPLEFLNQIKIFEDQILDLEDEYCFNFKSIFRLKKFLHSLIIPSLNSRLTSQIEYIKHTYLKEIRSLFLDSFYEININPDPFINELSEVVNQIFDEISMDKFKELINTYNVGILIVPERFVEAWKDDKKNDETAGFPVNLKIMTFNEFKANCTSLKTNKLICFLTIFGFKDTPFDILKFSIQSSLNILFILYPEEKLLADNLLIRCQNELIREYKSNDRFHLCKIEYPKNEENDDVSDLLDRLYAKNEHEAREYEYELSENVEYEIIFKDGSSEILDGSKSVLLENGISKRKEAVSNLITEDRIRVYENTSKESLFEIASESDEKGILIEIIEYSKLWKQCLIDYYNTKQSISFSANELLEELQKNGAKLQISTLKKWLNIDDKVLFPSQTLNLIAIKETIDCPVFKENLSNFKRSRKLYRSIMIALGRDLSDEIMDYIISGKQVSGKILSRFTKEQISRIIDANAPIETINSINIIESKEND